MAVCNLLISDAWGSWKKRTRRWKRCSENRRCWSMATKMHAQKSIDHLSKTSHCCGIWRGGNNWTKSLHCCGFVQGHPATKKHQDGLFCSADSNNRDRACKKTIWLWANYMAAETWWIVRQREAGLSDLQRGGVAEWSGSALDNAYEATISLANAYFELAWTPNSRAKV